MFFDSKSIESDTPFWSIWDPAPGLSYLPRRDDTIAALALQAIYDYWNTDGHNATSGAGLAMLQWAFCCVWNWDARPFPTFPVLGSAWGDAGNWAAGDWSNGLRTSLPPLAPTPPPTPGSFQTFPTLATLGWSVIVRPKFSTLVAEHVSGRSVRSAIMSRARRDIELTYELLRSDAGHAELQAIAGFFAEMSGQASPFWFQPPGLSAATGQALGTGDGSTTVFPLVQSIGGYSETVDGTSGVSAVYLNGVAQLSGWTVSRRLCAGHHLRERARRRRRRHGRLRRLVALPLRRGRAGFRGVHDDAVRAADAQADDGAAVTARVIASECEAIHEP